MRHATRILWLLAAFLAPPAFATGPVLDTGFPVFSDVHIGGSSSTTCPMTITTTGANRTLVVGGAQQIGASQTITIADTAGLTWTQLGYSLVDSRFSVTLFYATAPSTLSSDVITVTFGFDSGNACATWAYSGAGTPTNYTMTHSNTNTGTVASTIAAGTNSVLVGIGGDTTNDPQAYTPLANSSGTWDVGYAFVEYYAFWTPSAISGSTTFGSSAPTTETYGMASAEIPAAVVASAAPTRTLLGVGQ